MANPLKRIFQAIFKFYSIYADIFFTPDDRRPLAKEFYYFIDHNKELFKQYKGKYVVIKKQMVIGVYDSEIEAETMTLRDHEPDTFLIQKCELYPGSLSS